MIPALFANAFGGNKMDPNLVAALMNGRNNQDNWGGNGAWFLWIILLFGLFGRGGFGGWGGVREMAGCRGFFRRQNQLAGFHLRAAETRWSSDSYSTCFVLLCLVKKK